MKIRLIVTLSMLAGAAVGAAAVQGLHAQTRPMVSPAYLIVEAKITNHAAYKKKFVPGVNRAMTLCHANVG